MTFEPFEVAFKEFLDNQKRTPYYGLTNEIEKAFEKAENNASNSNESDFIFELKKFVLMEMAGRIKGKMMDDNLACNIESESAE